MSLEPFSIFTGKHVSIIRDNIDTDQIIPSREMKSISKLGLSDGLFAGQRYTEPGGRELNPDFVLNQSGNENAKVLLSGKNFGCGSSREHAVWALHEYGFRVIIAESFGDIFYNNCIKNGILSIQLSAEHIGIFAASDGVLTINLPAQTVTNGSDQFSFDTPAGDKRLLVEGLDSIALTETHSDDIEAFFAKDKRERVWLY